MESITLKQIYTAPLITVIQLDKEISLALESNVAPTGPDESLLKAPDYFNADPYKTNLG